MSVRTVVVLVVLNAVWFHMLGVMHTKAPSTGHIDVACHCTCTRRKCPKPLPLGLEPYETGTYNDWVNGRQFMMIGQHNTGEKHSMVSDKVDNNGVHHYSSMYQKYLQPYRDNGGAFNLLEIGAGPNGGGRGYRLYKAYAPNIVYHCLEFQQEVFDDLKTHKFLTEDEKAYLFKNMMRGDQSNTTDLQLAHERYGPFDIVIDDGGHQCRNQVPSFFHLFPLLNPGGTYFIEDLQTNFNKGFYCGEQVQRDHGTAVEVMRDIVTALHHHFWDPKERSNVFVRGYRLHESIVEWVQTVDCDREICAIRKRKTKLVRTKRSTRSQEP